MCPKSQWEVVDTQAAGRGIESFIFWKFNANKSNSCQFQGSLSCDAIGSEWNELMNENKCMNENEYRNEMMNEKKCMN